MHQAALFEELPPALPPGLVFEAEFLSAAEEADLLALLQTLPFEAAQYKGYTARRRIVGYGGRFDYDTNKLGSAPALIEALHPLRDKVADWAGVTPDSLAHALVAEYAPGTPLGWHRDVPDFEDVFGVSLGGDALMKLRPYPHEASSKHAPVVKLDLAPRSAYVLCGEARWNWQHCIAPVAAMRWSITFRTKR